MIASSVSVVLCGSKCPPQLPGMGIVQLGVRDRVDISVSTWIKYYMFYTLSSSFDCSSIASDLSTHSVSSTLTQQFKRCTLLNGVCLFIQVSYNACCLGKLQHALFKWHRAPRSLHKRSSVWRRNRQCAKTTGVKVNTWIYLFYFNFSNSSLSKNIMPQAQFDCSWWWYQSHWGI